MMISDVIIPDFNISIKINYKKKLMFLRKRLNQHFICWIINITNTTQKTTKTSTKNQRIKTLEEIAPEKIESDLQGQSGYLKKLSEKVNLESLTHVYENFFLYDLDNFIKPTFTTELQKEFSIYSLISFSGETKKDNKLELVSPQNRLKFEITRDIYKI